MTDIYIVEKRIPINHKIKEIFIKSKISLLSNMKCSVEELYKISDNEKECIMIIIDLSETKDLSIGRENARILFFAKLAKWPTIAIIDKYNYILKEELMKSKIIALSTEQLNDFFMLCEKEQTLNVCDYIYELGKFINRTGSMSIRTAYREIICIIFRENFERG